MSKKTILILIGVIIIVGISIFVGIQTFFPRGPLSDSECIKYLDGKISDVEFGRSKIQFTINSGLYPTVSAGSDLENKLCTKLVTVVLLDSENKSILEKAYNLPPIGKGGETGYGDFNQNRSLISGDYKFEFYYGDVLFKTINIGIK